MNHSLYKHMQIDPAKLMTVTLMGKAPNVLAERKNSAPNNLQEFIDYVRPDSRKVSYATQANVSISHLTARLYTQLTAKNMAPPVQGSAPVLVDLVGRNANVLFDNFSFSSQLYENGRIKVQAVADEQRSLTQGAVHCDWNPERAGMFI